MSAFIMVYANRSSSYFEKFSCPFSATGYGGIEEKITREECTLDWVQSKVFLAYK